MLRGLEAVAFLHHHRQPISRSIRLQVNPLVNPHATAVVKCQQRKQGSGNKGIEEQTKNRRHLGKTVSKTAQKISGTQPWGACAVRMDSFGQASSQGLLKTSWADLGLSMSRR
eukprot:1160985-Pelagomonas_calceolata.AAC.14